MLKYNIGLKFTTYATNFVVVTNKNESDIRARSRGNSLAEQHLTIVHNIASLGEVGGDFRSEVGVVLLDVVLDSLQRCDYVSAIKSIASDLLKLIERISIDYLKNI